MTYCRTRLVNIPYTVTLLCWMLVCFILTKEVFSSFNSLLSLLPIVFAMCYSFLQQKVQQCTSLEYFHM